jgi:hypothetical protein
MAPVMLLFSFLIAREYCEDSHSRDIDRNAMTIAQVQAIAEERRHHLDVVAKGISKAAWKDVWGTQTASNFHASTDDHSLLLIVGGKHGGPFR